MNSYSDHRLVDALLAGDDKDGSLALTLLDAIYSGAPIDQVALLLHSDRESAVKAGAWILSELGADGRVLIEELPRLLDHESTYIRHFAIDALISMATPDDGPLLARAVELINDPDTAVRSKALRLLAAVSLDALDAASVYVVTDYRERLSWLTNRGADADYINEILAYIIDDDVLWRRFGTAAAARVAERTQAGLKLAARSADSDLRNFASLELSVLSLDRG